MFEDVGDVTPLKMRKMEKMRELSYKMAPKDPNEEDNNLSRMIRWEKEQGMKLNELTEWEWIDVIHHILPLTKQEAGEYLTHLRTSKI